jgi:hypothetical protein
MSSKKRVSVSPASVAALKRQFSLDASEDLQCLICQELVVDAVQVVCCGALHCRACISKCDRCPQCRKLVTADCIVRDVRCERLAAACLRPCPNAQHGCDFNGNRASVTEHEAICDFVPRSVLRQKIQAVELELQQQASLVEGFALRLETYAARLQRQQTQADERSKLQQQFALENRNMLTTMMRCALGSDPAEAALRVLHSVPEVQYIAAVDRAKARGTSHTVFTFPEWHIKCVVHELNHNVAVWFRKLPDFTPKQPGTNAAFALLHPYDATLSKKGVVDVSKLNDSDGHGWTNFMTSKELDKYTVNGKYYVA